METKAAEGAHLGKMAMWPVRFTLGLQSDTSCSDRARVLLHCDNLPAVHLAAHASSNPWNGGVHNIGDRTIRLSRTR